MTEQNQISEEQTIKPNEQQEQESNWKIEEYEELKKNNFDGERLPSWIFPEENKIYEIEIDDSQKFSEWRDKETDMIKKIIPVTVNNEKYNWWLNVKNPIYTDIMERLVKDINKVKAMRNGSKQNTKYVIVE